MTTQTLRAPARRAARSSLDRTAIWIASAFGYLGISYLLLRPILRTYVIADDFQAPLSQFAAGATSLSRTFSWAWANTVVGGDSARAFGGFAGAVFNYLWLWSANTFGISVLDTFAIARFACLVACAAALASVWWIAARSYYRPIRWSTAVLLSSVALFGTVQLHGSWSNDPVESYPLAGYAAAAVGFAFLAMAVWVARRPTPVLCLLAAVAAVLTVSYYEFNFGAVLGAALILAASAWEHRRRRREWLVRLIGAAAVFLAPVIWLLASGAQNSGASYSGRSVQLSGTFHSLLIGLVSSLPGAAWSLSSQILGGNDAILVLPVITGIVVVVATALWLRTGGRDPIAPGPAPAERSNLMLGAVAAAVVIYAVFAIGLEAATVKVQQEALKIGYVYTAYAVGSATVALVLAAVAWRLLSERRRGWLMAKIVLAIGVVALISVQNSFNSHLKDTLNNGIPENQALDNVLAAEVPEPTRCATLRYWISNLWPAYYRAGVVRGAEAEYLSFHGQPLCREFIAPGNGFDRIAPPPATPQWWLEAQDGTIDLRTRNCAGGCRGVLYFMAGGLANPHDMTLRTEAMRAVHLHVPNHWKKFAVPVRLTGTYTHIGVTVSGTAVTPVSVKAGPGTIPYFIDIVDLRFKRT